MSKPDYEAAWHEVGQQMFEGGELSYEVFLEIGQRTGTLQCVPFDPEKHGNTVPDYMDEPMPGDDWYLLPPRRRKKP